MKSTWQHVLQLLFGLGMVSLLGLAPAMAAEPKPATEAVALPFQYARAWKKPAPVYASPGDPGQMTPIATFLPPDSWVSIDEKVEQGGQLWYRIDDQAYVLASDLLASSPSAFQGMSVAEPPQHPIGYVIAQELNVRARPGALPDNPAVVKLRRYDTVTVLDRVNGPDGAWLQIGADQYVHSAYVRVIFPVQRPAEVPADGRWFAVDLAQQVLSAYEGDRMVYATLVSTGRPPFYTPQGLYRVWIKLQTGPMEGGDVAKGDYYYLQDVPWIMYFAKDVGLHGAYWHDRFGTASSHGCVNLSPADAKWLFDWATPLLPFPDTRYVYASKNNPGAWVYVYASSG
jgi:hypothetical protein